MPERSSVIGNLVGVNQSLTCQQRSQDDSIYHMTQNYIPLPFSPSVTPFSEGDKDQAGQCLICCSPICSFTKGKLRPTRGGPRALLGARFYSLKIKTVFSWEFLFSQDLFSFAPHTCVLHPPHTLSFSLSLTHTHTHRCSDREIAPKPVINPDTNDKAARMCRHCATGRRKDVHLFSTTKGEKNEVINQGARHFY